jgi:hypothetical protein
MLKSLFKHGAIFLFATLPLIVLLSCAQKQDLAGKWQEIGKKSTIEFHTDSTFNEVDDMGMAVSGKYTLQENGSIRFEITHEGSAPEIVEGKLSERGDELTFSSANDKKVATYKRVK